MKIIFAALFAVVIFVAASLFFGSSGVDAHAFDDAFAKLKKDDPNIAETQSGMLVKVLAKGNAAQGKSPTVNDRCSCHYTGWLLNKDGSLGSKFDSSVDRGQPFQTAPSGVISAWKEAMQFMVPGDKVRMYAPADLGYGSRGAGGVIPGNAALVFDMEMLAVGGNGKGGDAAREAFKKTTGKDFEEL